MVEWFYCFRLSRSYLADNFLKKRGDSLQKRGWYMFLEPGLLKREVSLCFYTSVYQKGRSVYVFGARSIKKGGESMFLEPGLSKREVSLCFYSSVLQKGRWVYVLGARSIKKGGESMFLGSNAIN